MRVDLENLKKEIERQNLTLEELGNKSGIDKSTLSRFLNGSSGCTIETAQKIIKGLKLSNKKASSIFFNRDVA